MNILWIALFGAIAAAIAGDVVAVYLVWCVDKKLGKFDERK
jgi:hypothetical protein